MDLKNYLLNMKLVVDNEYLDKYVKLIEVNKNTKSEKFKTQCHHIIPVFYFNINKIEVDNSPNNKVNLVYSDHILAHCYLSLCSLTSEYCYKNQIAIYKILGSKNNIMTADEKEKLLLLKEIQLAYERSREVNYQFNPMFNKDKKEKHDKIMRSEEVRKKISETMKQNVKEGKLFSEEHRKHLSESAFMRTYFFKDGKIIHTNKNNYEKIESLLRDGWTSYSDIKKESIKKCCVNDNIFATRSISCYCVLEDGRKFEFKSILDAGKWWYENYKPFGEIYSNATYQRKIKKSIRGELIEFSQPNKKDYRIIMNIKWFKGE